MSRFIYIFIALLSLICSLGNAMAAASSPSDGGCGYAPCRYGVGYRVIQAEVNGRTINIAVWYPADVAPASITYGTAHVAGTAVKDAPVKRGSWPLVVFAHGYSGSGIGSATLAETVASYGFVWAAPDLTDEIVEVRINGPVTGNIRDALRKLGDKPPSLDTYGYRIEQTRSTLDTLLARPEFNLDAERITLAGHSLGAWTVMHLALVDPRPKSIVLYSMGELNYLFKHERFFSEEELSQLKIPAFYLYGSKEKQAVERFGPPNSVFAYRNTRAQSCLVEIRGGNHFVYVNREVAHDNGGNVTQLQRIGQATASFLGHYLTGLDNKVIADQCK